MLLPRLHRRPKPRVTDRRDSEEFGERLREHKAAQPATIEIEERHYGKEVTIVKGLDDRDIDLKRLASEFKSALACGGTTHEGAIELQGNHRDRIDAVLAKNGLEVR